MTGSLASRVRVRSVKLLDRFSSDHAICLYAASTRGLPVRRPLLESGFRVLEHDMGNVIHERECLEVSPYTVLPPPEIEDGGKPLKMRQKRHGSVGGSLRAGDD